VVGAEAVEVADSVDTIGHPTRATTLVIEMHHSSLPPAAILWSWPTAFGDQLTLTKACPPTNNWP
jgi:hypothetical protein